MSYSIHYGPQGQKIKKERKNRPHTPWLIAALLVTVIGVGVLFPQSIAQFKVILFPWTEPYVQTAFTDFTDSLREGDAFRNALKDLYVDLLKSANEKQ